MAKSIFITGTNTNIGKTVVSAGLVNLLKSNGFSVCYYKPILSGAIDNGSHAIPGDTRFVCSNLKLKENLEDLTPYIFKTPVSPHLAARLEQKSINVDTILEQFNKLDKKYDYIIVEGAGGLAVPINYEGYMMFHLIKDLKLDCLLVTNSALGSINHTVLTTSFAKTVGINIKGIIINSFTNNEFEIDTVNMISRFTNIPLLGTIPKLENISVDEMHYGNLFKVFKEFISIDKLLEVF